MAQQLALDLGGAPPASLANFIGNTEVVRALNELLDNDCPRYGQQNIYLCGQPGSGRTHLLAAACAHVQRQGQISCSLGSYSGARDFFYSTHVTLYTVDDVEQLDNLRQIALFNLFNQIVPGQQKLICAGAEVPLGLKVREDLRTRLAWGLVFRLNPLSDDEKITALMQAAQARGLQLSPDVPTWLIKHYQRDLRSLMRVLDALDQFSLEKKRAVTLPLMRELFARLGE